MTSTESRWARLSVEETYQLQKRRHWTKDGYRWRMKHKLYRRVAAKDTKLTV